MKKIVLTDAAPAAVGPYSQAVWAGDLLYCSGQLGIDPVKGAFAGPDVESQTEQALSNVLAVLKSQGLSAADVVKVLVFLADMSDFGRFNGIYARVFGTEPPARSCVAVAALPLGGLVEIEAIARGR
ncbi:MAG: RidA family protein [Synergistaceae bacterium]|jgi:2-iminobutanoate/2-iminopropanoate deaminase|nr:RidA family protein [Synergistaceae bacterium]